MAPLEGAHLWDWFWSLSGRRRSGPEAISFAEIGEWQRLTRTPATPAEIEILLQMDEAFLAAARQEQLERDERERDRLQNGKRR